MSMNTDTTIYRSDQRYSARTMVVLGITGFMLLAPLVSEQPPQLVYVLIVGGAFLVAMGSLINRLGSHMSVTEDCLCFTLGLSRRVLTFPYADALVRRPTGVWHIMSMTNLVIGTETIHGETPALHRPGQMIDHLIRRIPASNWDHNRPEGEASQFQSTNLRFDSNGIHFMGHDKWWRDLRGAVLYSIHLGQGYEESLILSFKEGYLFVPNSQWGFGALLQTIAAVAPVDAIVLL